MDNKGQQVLKAFKRLTAQRSVIDQYWKEAFDYSYPVRGQGFWNDTDAFANASTAKQRQAMIYDSTSTDACRLLAASMIGGLTPTTSQWFSLSVPNVPDKFIPLVAREWLQGSAETLFSMIHSSNYNAQAYEFFIDIAVAGMAGLYIELNNETGSLHFEAWPLDSLYVAE